jgi:hypothetical protein
MKEALDGAIAPARPRPPGQTQHCHTPGHRQHRHRNPAELAEGGHLHLRGETQEQWENGVAIAFVILPLLGGDSPNDTTKAMIVPGQFWRRYCYRTTSLRQRIRGSSAKIRSLRFVINIFE